MLAKVFLQKILVEDPVSAGPFFTTPALAGSARVVPVFFGMTAIYFT